MSENGSRPQWLQKAMFTYLAQATPSAKANVNQVTGWMKCSKHFPSPFEHAEMSSHLEQTREI